MKTRYVDLQVNGFGGIDFSSPDLSLTDVHTVTRTLRKRGVGQYLATLITAPEEVYQRNLPLIARAMEEDKGGGLLGIHMEGPFLSPEDGPRGVHPRAYIKTPNISMFQRFQVWANGNIRLLTIAPELKGAPELISSATKSGTIVSLGHSSAKRDDIERAVEAGATCWTHFGNGMEATVPRHDNLLWPVLANERLSVMLIADGFHLPADFIHTCIRAKGLDKVIMASDVVHLAGLTPGEYDFHGERVVLELNQHLHVKGDYRLSGAAKDLAECGHVMRSLGYSSEDIHWMAYENPLRLIGK